jgi:hypothetical protein
MNAPRLRSTELQWLMQHANLSTTARFYIDPTAGQEDVVGRLHVPEVLRKRTG